MPVPGGVFQSHLPGNVKVESLSKLIVSIKNFCKRKSFASVLHYMLLNVLHVP